MNNSLSETKPELAREWHPTKNGKLKPEDVTIGSHKKVWWIGSCGHEWETSTSERVRGRGCPICAGKIVLKGFNDLESKNPFLAREWHPTKNEKLTPDEVTIGSHKKVWWLGSCGHEWEAVVKDRVQGNGCPICAGKVVVEGTNDLKSIYPLLAREWHPSKNKELLPTQVIAKSSKKVWWLGSCGHEWEASASERARGRGCPICAGKIVLKGFNDLESKNLFLTKEWHPVKNGELSPSEITPQSHKKVWWECSICGSEWEATVYSRQVGNGCPKCAKRLQSSFPEQALYYYIRKAFPDAVNGYRDIFDHVMELDIYIPSEHVGIEYDGKHWHPYNSREREITKYRICKENKIKLIRVREQSNLLDYEICDDLIVADRNNDTTIKRVTDYLGIKVDINTSRDRTIILSKYIKQLKSNNLSLLYPELASAWHPTKNSDLKPNFFTPHNDTKVWWLCSNGHEYQCTIAHRVAGSNCPYCSNRKLLKGYNDFATTNDNPQLLEEWDYEKNEKCEIYPDSLTKGSKKKVWWKCSKGHSWQTTISERNRGSGCPVCSGRVVNMGVNDFATMRPELIPEWNYSKNVNIKPSEVSVGSNKKVWWICKTCGNEWEASVQVRSRGTGCPKCAEKKKITTASFISAMNEINPSIEIHGEYINTETKVECVCKKCGYSWKATPHMLKCGHGCPACAGRVPLKGRNDLKTVNPILASEWHPALNRELLPEDVLPKSNKKVWWKCRICGNEWAATINSRAYGAGCPACDRRRRGKKAEANI